MKVIRDRELFDKQLLENKEAALQMLKDGDGNYLEEIRIGKQKYKIYTEAADALFFESASYLLPEGYAAFIVGGIKYEKKEIGRSDFKNWYFVGDADFKGAGFTGIASFSGALVTGVADFRGAKFARYADFAGAKFGKLKDSVRC